MMRDRVKSVDRRYTFSSSFPLLNVQRAVVLLAILAPSPFWESARLVVREARWVVERWGGEKGVKRELNLFIYHSYRFLLVFFFLRNCLSDTRKLNFCIYSFSFGGCQFPDGFHVQRWSQANQSRRTHDSGSVGSYPHLDAIRYLLLVAGKCFTHYRSKSFFEFKSLDVRHLFLRSAWWMWRIMIVAKA